MQISQDIKALQQALVKKGGNTINIITGENVTVNQDGKKADDTVRMIPLSNDKQFAVRQYQLDNIWEVFETLGSSKLEKLSAMIYYLMDHKGFNTDKEKAKWLSISPRVFCYNVNKYRLEERSDGGSKD